MPATLLSANPKPSELYNEVLRRRQARRGLLDFCRYVSPGYQTPTHIKQLAYELECIANGENDRLMVFMPPRHGKSMETSQLFPAWMLGTRPDVQIVVAGYGEDIALDQSRASRGFFSSDAYRALFPNVRTQAAEKRADKPIERKAAGEWATTQGGRYYAVGVGGGLTGRGADIAIIDDPVKNREDAESPRHRAKTWDWYRATFYTRLSPAGAIILVQTRWHHLDLAGMLLAEMKAERGDKWRIVNLPAISDDGEPLWPEQFSLARLEKIRGALGDREFDALYQQSPQIDDYRGALWSHKVIDDHRIGAPGAPQEVPPLVLVVTGVDPSGSATGDEAGIVSVGVGEDGHIYPLRDDSVQALPEVWAARAVDSLRLSEGNRIKAEANFGGGMVRTTIGTVDPYVPVDLVHASRGKYVRAEPVSAMSAHGHVHFPRDPLAMGKLEAELCTWQPGDPSPNRMDAYVWAVTGLVLDRPEEETVERYDARQEFGIDTSGHLE